MKKQRLHTKKLSIRFGVYFLVAVFILPVLFSVIGPQQKAYAAESAVWLNAQKIKKGDTIFTASLNDLWTTDVDNLYYKHQHDGCSDKIGNFDNGNDAKSENKDLINGNGDISKDRSEDTPVSYYTQVKTASGCKENKEPKINLGDRWNRLATFSYSNQTTITAATDQPQGSIKEGETFVSFSSLSDGVRAVITRTSELKGKTDKLFFRSKEAKANTLCMDYMEIGGLDEGGKVRSAKLVEQNTDNSNQGGPVKGCYLANGVGGGFGGDNDGTVVNVWINGIENANKKEGTPVAGTTGAGGGGDNNEALSCDGSFSFDNPLNWLICPIVTGIQGAFEVFDNAVTNLLTINTKELFDNPSDPTSVSYGLYTAWSGFRYIAMGLLVIFALVMIISQAIGTGPFDAYTIKRVLPRILVAIILIALSWELMKFAISLSNSIGNSVGSLILQPFNGFNSGGIDGSGLAGVLAFSATGGLIALGPFGLLSFALTGLIAVLTALAVLVLRQMIIIFLVVLAPVALICNVLPNTQRAWKMWSDYFMRALLLFPMFTGFVAIGRAFSGIALELFPGTLGTMIGFIAYIAPYFMLPTLFKMSGGALATLAGFAAGATAGMRGGLANYRKGQAAKNMQGLKTGTRFSDRNKLTRGINTAGAGLGTGGFSGAFGLNKKGKANIERVRTAAQAERMKEAGVQDALYDDGVRLALMNGNVRDARAALDAKGVTGEDQNDAIAMARSIGFDRNSQLAAFNFEAANKSRNFVDTDGKSANEVMVETANKVAAGTGIDASRLLSSYTYAAGTQGGRLDLREEKLDDVLEKRFDTRLLQATTPAGWKAITGRNVELLKNGNDTQRKRAGAQLIAMQESLAGASEGSRAEYTKIMEGAGIDFADGRHSIESQLAGMTELQTSDGTGTMSQDQAAAYFRNTSSTYGSADRQYRADRDSREE